MCALASEALLCRCWCFRIAHQIVLKLVLKALVRSLALFGLQIRLVVNISLVVLVLLVCITLKNRIQLLKLLLTLELLLKYLLIEGLLHLLLPLVHKVHYLLVLHQLLAGLLTLKLVALQIFHLPPILEEVILLGADAALRVLQVYQSLLMGRLPIPQLLFQVGVPLAGLLVQFLVAVELRLQFAECALKPYVVLVVLRELLLEVRDHELVLPPLVLHLLVESGTDLLQGLVFAE